MKKPKIYVSAVREMPLEERPRERLARLGPEALRDAELLAILFRSGMRGLSAVDLAQRLLTHFGGLRNVARASIEELQQVKGMGEVKAIEVKAALELGMRLSDHREAERPQIRDAEDVKNLMIKRFRQLETEHLRALLLNTKNEVLRIAEISRGSLDSTGALPRDVFREAVRIGATGVIVCHNHPSGHAEPSRSDVELTERLAKSAELLGVRFLDHVVFGDSSAVSMKERGLF